ncbi:MAG: YtxH domain-containing protein [Flavobacteriales bacterium]|nr:YtxH domain-containing protein [Flavobacteriales bacterium]
MTAKSTVAIAITALAAGAALGILFAPDSGAATRKKIVKKGNDLRDRLTDLVGKGEELAEDLKKQANDVTEKAKHAARTATS